MSRKDIDEEARRVALNYLARRDYSQQEMIQKLTLKGYPSEIISTVVENLTLAKLINESRFTENYIHSRSAKGYGPLRISLELQTRGIAAEMIAEQLKINDNVWFIQVQKVWQKYFRGKLTKDFKLRSKQIRFLQYRGFTQKQIESVFEES